MKKFHLVLLSLIVLALTLCSSSESPEASFEKLKQAACQGNADEVLDRVDVSSLAVSLYKENNPQADDTAIKSYKSTSQFTEQVNQMSEAIKKKVTQKNSDLCKLIFKESKIEGDVAVVHVQEDSTNPYYIEKFTFKKNESRWIWVSVDGFVNPPIEVTATNLYNEYQSNVVSADQKYKGKTIRLSGKINQIGKDIADRIFITVGKGIVGDVYCYISSSYVNKTASLKPGDSIIITGVCNGKTIIPELKECVF